MSPAVDLLLFYLFAFIVAVGLPAVALAAAKPVARLLADLRALLRTGVRAMREAVTR